jgi:hypothetical protein
MSAEEEEKMEVDRISDKNVASDKGSDSEDDSSEETSDNDEELEKQASDLERKVKYSYRNVYPNLKLPNFSTYFQWICCICLLFFPFMHVTHLFLLLGLYMYIVIKVGGGYNRNIKTFVVIL